MTTHAEQHEGHADTEWIRGGDCGTKVHDESGISMYLSALRESRSRLAESRQSEANARAENERLVREMAALRRQNDRLFSFVHLLWKRTGPAKSVIKTEWDTDTDPLDKYTAQSVGLTADDLSWMCGD